MVFNLSEICTMLGDRIEQYNSSNRKRKVSRERVVHAKIARLRSEKEYKEIFSQKCISTSTPIRTPKLSKKQQSPASFSSATKTIQETSKRIVYMDIFSQKCISTSTPVQTPKSLKNQQISASFTSPTKTIQETPKRRVLRVHRKIISNARRLTFDIEDFDNN